ncbi:hypothetical protein ACFWYW_23845 [Nonomuraea sp. NPDC059023]|uniref:hypothetical protein n=1 Tax=unclassified Nonomuraea TaxID=2593643 RepID=UPI003685B3E5
MYPLSIRRPAAEALAYRVEPIGHLCPACFPPYNNDDAEIGEVYPWTLDMEPGEPEFTCALCARVIATAPPEPVDD